MTGTFSHYEPPTGEGRQHPLLLALAEARRLKVDLIIGYEREGDEFFAHVAVVDVYADGVLEMGEGALQAVRQEGSA